MKKLLLLCAVFSVAGCECAVLDEPVLPRPKSDGGALPNMHPECAGAARDEAPAEVLGAPRLAGVDDGVVESPLTANGCLVQRDRYVSSRRVGLSLVRYLGYAVLLDGGSPTTFNYGPAQRELMAVSLEANGSLNAKLDADGDGTLDGEIDEQRANGRLQKRTATVFDQANGDVKKRETLSLVNADTIHFKAEEVENGVLSTLREFDAPNRQKQKAGCYQPRPMGASDTVPCSMTDEQLRARVRSALRRMSTCLTNLGAKWSFDQLELFLLDDIKAGEMNIECFRDPTYAGEALSADDTLRLNEDMLTCDTADFIDATLVHEMLHFTRGPHEFENPSGNYGPRADTYSDTIRSCEALCFGTLKTRCSCAKCLRTKACDSRCSSFSTCVEKNDAGVAVTSEAVGALCKGANAWFSTMMACQAAGGCSTGASDCKSYSVSCDKSCQ
jgi:hypothetical protein